MKHALWSAVHTVIEEVSLLLSGPGGEGEAPRRGVMRLGAQQAAGALTETAQVRDLVQLRAALRTQLDILKAALEETLNERETYLVLFPIVVHFDELVQRSVFRGQGEWPPLQKELFDLDNGGEVVFEMIDDLVRKEQTLPFVFEIFYFCLADGLRGRYVDDLSKLREYQRKLKARIPLARMKTLGAKEQLEEPPAPPSVLWYYLGSGLLIAACYFGILALVQL